jgi:hypothetical protein
LSALTSKHRKKKKFQKATFQDFYEYAIRIQIFQL